ncbi:MAG: response regulator [Cyanobacteria bacterium]|jgi:chemotaxis family two-component system response regulator PixG|nr:response regulator [Cyanobacteria bacterium CG_2015-16_32_12]NCO76946.1 response regulator [Cyanobacteria bacterium CG_2015-22_32_23]NCQ03831.1 response regulator [Cyanobacteria bacterium CG_2015-09_32_10]NCS84980.1 response regulator [Cyanobacteria bacterium CG_2015-02_32_10]
MDTPNKENYSVPIKGFVASKQTYLFNTLKKHQFTGEVKLVYPGRTEWRFYLYMGRLIYGTGGEHSVRRWRRNLVAYLPSIATDSLYLEQQIQSISHDNIKFCWEYELLRNWLLNGKADRESVIKMVNNILGEIFFDLNQTVEITFHLDNAVNVPIAEQMFLLDANQVIVPAWQQWQGWIGIRLGDRSPNKAPVIRSGEKLQESISPKTYAAFSKLFNGRNTLRDLSIQLKRDLSQFSSSLLPYIQQGYIDLVSVADLPAPISPPTVIQPDEKSPLIACIDDSPMICETMATIVKKAGFQFVGITEPLKAIAKILAVKPDLIFLDLIMPNTNGYEICGSLRKLSMFRQTPIIIVTSNDGMIERMRTKMVGASDFIAKPIKPEDVTNILNKYLSN